MANLKDLNRHCGTKEIKHTLQIWLTIGAKVILTYGWRLGSILKGDRERLTIFF